MTDRAREKALKVGVAHAAWHSGPGVKVESVLAAIVETLGVTDEMVDWLNAQHKIGPIDEHYGITRGHYIPLQIADALETLLEASR